MRERFDQLIGVIRERQRNPVKSDGRLPGRFLRGGQAA
jgi:hypothetical protein